MGSTSSKAEKNDALRLCRERRRYIKHAIDSRYNLAAAHVSYIISLKNIGLALRRFAEAEILIEASLSTASATELGNEKTPSHSSYPSPSPSHLAEIPDSPMNNESPISPPVVNLGYIKAGVGGSSGGSVVNVKVDLNHGVGTSFVVEENESLWFSMAMLPPPPPPPHFESGGSWDFFYPSDECESFKFVGHSELDVDFGDVTGWDNEFGGEKGCINDNMVDAKGQYAKLSLDRNCQAHEGSISFSRNGSNGINLVSDECSAGVRGVKYCGQQAIGCKVEQVERVGSGNGLALESSASKKDNAMALKSLSAEREDASEFITHRAKDFLSSIKDIEHRFFRASVSGKEVSRMLEANNIRIGYSEATGRLPTSVILAAFRLACCHGSTALVSHESTEHVTKVITWKRTTSVQSSSSRNPLASGTKDDISDSGSDFAEEFCMIAGSHSSTLDRLYAWERKLFDEIKASESIRMKYDQKCGQLRHQFAKDVNAQLIDKTRAVIKDLHSRIKVDIHSVETISKRIEKMRDDELQPQLLELIQALVRMWKAMLECHHAQYITISLAYHTRKTGGTLQGDSRRQIMAQVQQEVEYFGLSFVNWVNSHASYVESLNGWLQNCIVLPQERSKSRRPFSPCRALAPPIFVLCRDWSAGIQALPSEELNNAIKTFLSDLQHQMEEEAERSGNKESINDENKEEKCKDDEKSEVSTNLCCMHGSLTKVLDSLHKFSEASLKMYEDIRQKTEAARLAYLNGRPTGFSCARK